MCMNSNHKMVPCSHIHVGFGYSRRLIGAIMDVLPKFVHKHTVIYKMYSTLKLYYLNQQELLAEVLEILRSHLNSHQLAHRMFAYMKELHGGNYSWVNQIKGLLKKHMKMEMGDIKSMT